MEETFKEGKGSKEKAKYTLCHKTDRRGCFGKAKEETLAGKTSTMRSIVNLETKGDC